MSYVWSPDLETGNAAIDRQHQELFDMVDALVEAYASGKGRQEVEKTMEFLVGYSIKHFADEEKLQKEHGYPDHLRHRGIHIEFRHTVEELVAVLLRDGPTDVFIREVYITVGEWLTNHIKGEDFKMAAYVQSKRKTV